MPASRGEWLPCVRDKPDERLEELSRHTPLREWVLMIEPTHSDKRTFRWPEVVTRAEIFEVSHCLPYGPGVN